MTKFKELAESVGIDADKVNDFEQALTEMVNKEIEEKLAESKAEMETKYNADLAKKAAEYKKLAEEKAQIEYADKAEKLQEWHEYVIAEELKQVDEQLKVAEEVRNVRLGLQKIVEGMNEAGMPLTQVFEAAVVAEISALQESIEAYDAITNTLEKDAKAYQRAFLVSEATVGLTSVQKDAVIKQADVIDESLSADEFKSVLDIIIADKKGIAESKKADDEDDADKDADKKAKGVNEGVAVLDDTRFVGKGIDESFDIDRLTTFR